MVFPCFDAFYGFFIMNTKTVFGFLLHNQEIRLYMFGQSPGAVHGGRHGRIGAHLWALRPWVYRAHTFQMSDLLLVIEISFIGLYCAMQKTPQAKG